MGSFIIARIIIDPLKIVYDFTTLNSDPLLSGVNNRNHCPYCLATKHVDLFRAGDRLNACKGRMQAVGLAWKPSQNKYGSQFGELMIIHLCKECGSVSFNRVAADNSEKLINLFAQTVTMDKSSRARFQQCGFHLLEPQHQQEFERCLFGSIKLKVADYF